MSRVRQGSQAKFHQGPEHDTGIPVPRGYPRAMLTPETHTTYESSDLQHLVLTNCQPMRKLALCVGQLS